MEIIKTSTNIVISRLESIKTALARYKAGKATIDFSLTADNIKDCYVEIAYILRACSLTDNQQDLSVSMFTFMSNFFNNKDIKELLVFDYSEVDENLDDLVKYLDIFINAVKTVQTLFNSVRVYSYRSNKTYYAVIEAIANELLATPRHFTFLYSGEMYSLFSTLDEDTKTRLKEHGHYYAATFNGYFSYDEYRLKLYTKVLTQLSDQIWIENNAFDFLYTNQDNAAVLRDPKESMKIRQSLYKNLTYLRVGGYLFYNVKAITLNKMLLNALVSHLEDIRVIKSGSESEQILIIGKKRAKPIKDMDKALEIANQIYAEPLITIGTNENKKVIIGKLDIPAQGKEIKTFRSIVITEDDVETLSEISTNLDRYLDRTYKRKNEKKARPLLPFNVGQLGLVLTSGCLDGVVTEKDTYGHLVKGRVVKVVDTTRDILENDEEETASDTIRQEVVTTTSNRVEINILLPDGTFKRLM